MADGLRTASPTRINSIRSVGDTHNFTEAAKSIWPWAGLS
jgi:hypothetical protein